VLSRIIEEKSQRRDLRFNKYFLLCIF